ncbi:MAG: hypothetical protein KAT46_00420 [Deltaproteobacteria bacterium]|nr:hypothetical protein [Deltaproteobacteria bacterium]
MNSPKRNGSIFPWGKKIHLGFALTERVEDANDTSSQVGQEEGSEGNLAKKSSLPVMDIFALSVEKAENALGEGSLWELRGFFKEQVKEAFEFRASSGILSLKDKESLSDSLKKLTGSSALGLRANAGFISLPDSLVRASIIEFDELPKSSEEAGDVIGWQAAREFYIKPEDSIVSYQRLGLEAETDGKVSVFVVVAKKDLISSLEESFSDQGMGVGMISTHSLNILNLLVGVLPLMKELSNFVFILRVKTLFTIFFLVNGKPVFYRSKEVSDLRDFLFEVEQSFTFFKGKNRGVELERVVLVDSTVIENKSTSILAKNLEEVLQCCSEVLSLSSLLEAGLVKSEGLKTGGGLSVNENGPDSIALLAALGALESSL